MSIIELECVAIKSIIRENSFRRDPSGITHIRMVAKIEEISVTFEQIDTEKIPRKSLNKNLGQKEA